MWGTRKTNTITKPGRVYNKKSKESKQKQDMTVPFARARDKLGGSIRLSALTILKA